jgi:hypothetical protein
VGEFYYDPDTDVKRKTHGRLVNDSAYETLYLETRILTPNNGISEIGRREATMRWATMMLVAVVALVAEE